MNSKEKFLEASLELFSKRGYVGVSVRDIAKELGMRESAMYKHYSSKAQILESIITRASEKLEAFQSSVAVYGEIIGKIVTNFFVRVFDFYTKDDFMNKFRKLMIISQYENEESKSRYQEMFVEKSLRYYEEIFEKFKEEKDNKNCNARLMAYELYSVLFISMQQYDSISNEEQLEQAKKLLIEHIESFFARYSFLEA